METNKCVPAIFNVTEDSTVPLNTEEPLKKSCLTSELSSNEKDDNLLNSLKLAQIHYRVGKTNNFGILDNLIDEVVTHFRSKNRKQV